MLYNDPPADFVLEKPTFASQVMPEKENFNKGPDNGNSCLGKEYLYIWASTCLCDGIIALLTRATETPDCMEKLKRACTALLSVFAAKLEAWPEDIQEYA